MIIEKLFTLKNKVSIITGGGRGLGLTIAKALAKAGSDIILCSRKIENCTKEAKRIGKLGVRCAAVKCDVTNQEDVQQLVRFALSEFGNVDILINNAGATWAASIFKYPLKGWNKVLNVNVTGTFLCCQAIGKIMAEKKKGKIINISSITGVSGSDPSYMNAVAYNASKGAINTLTKDLAVKLAPYNINVNALAPGFMVSDMTRETIEHHQAKMISRIPFGRIARSDDLEGSIIFLSSSASNYITGQILFVDGGWHAM